MPRLLETCTTLFNTSNLYEVLAVKKDANDKAIKKGYHKVSLKVHPDRVSEEEKEEATIKFQTLGKVYSILSDKDKRAVYDESGEVDEEDLVTQDRDWHEYWRLLFKKLTVEDIKNFEKEYKDSEEELNDLKQAYTDGKGCMKYILENVLCASYEDEPRFINILQALIEKKEITAYKKFTQETEAQKKLRKRTAKKEAAEADQLAQKLGLRKEENSLEALIQKRQKQREKDMDSFFDDLAKKYGAKEKKKKGK